jgi:hypothetical protein
MVWFIPFILLVLWGLGIAGSYTLGGFIHILPVVALAGAAARLAQRRSSL